MDLLKKCPNCGRHFSVEKKGEEVVETEHHVERVDMDLTTQSAGLVHDLSLQHPAPNPISEEVPVETETVEKTYECAHCHHKWTEKSVEVVEGSADAEEFRT